MAKIDTKPTPTLTPTPDEKSPSTVTYRDLAFKSRTLVLADGRSFAEHSHEQLVAKLQRISSQASEHSVEWLVEDQGSGIPKAIRQQVFEPFFTTKEPGHGTGLGLYVSYLIVRDNHGGDLLVESAPGKGAAFHVRLPLHVPPRKDVHS